MPLSRAQRHDTRDTEWPELKLIRVGQYLFSLWKKSTRKSDPLSEQMALEEALETVYRIKREYRAERDECRKLANAEVRERFAASHTSSRDKQIQYQVPLPEGNFSAQPRV